MAACSEATPTRVQKRAALCLCLLCETLKDVHSVGPLLEGLGFWFGDMYWGRWSSAGCYALCRLMPNLQAEDRVWLTERQVGVLERMASQLWTARMRNVRNEPDLQFYTTVLFALGQVGAKSALPVQEKLAKVKVDSEAKEAVRNAAQEACQAIEVRLQV